MRQLPTWVKLKQLLQTDTTTQQDGTSRYSLVFIDHSGLYISLQ